MRKDESGNSLSEADALSQQMSRRRALANLGLGASAVYLAPTVLSLTGARADDEQKNSPPWNQPSKPSKPSNPSGPSKPKKDK